MEEENTSLKSRQVTKVKSQGSRRKVGQSSKKREGAGGSPGIDKQKSSFDIAKKKELACLLKQYPSIWDLAHHEHKDHTAQLPAWEEIAMNLNETVEECMKTWKSMRGSYRYHLNKRPYFKSGDSGDEDTQESTQGEEVADNWVLWNDMKFLTQAKRTRTTISSGDMDSEPATPESFDESMPSSLGSGSGNESRSNYAYLPSNPKSSATEKLAHTLSSFIQLKTNQMDSSSTKPTRVTELKHYTMLSNLDRMWSQLPNHVVEDLNMKALIMAHEELQKYSQVVVIEQVDVV